MNALEAVAVADGDAVEMTAAECAARAGIYRLIAGTFVEEPTSAYLQALRSADSLAALSELGLKFDSDFLDTPITELEQAVACEYTQMFASSGGFPPVESVRREGGFAQTSHTEVCKIYRAHGFSVVPGRFRVFEDHLGVELQFGAALLDRQAAALEAGDVDGARRSEKELKRFWVQHMGRWVRGYAQLVTRAAEHSLFREMARLLEMLANSELESLGIEVADEDGGKIRVPKPEMPEGGGCGGGR